MAHRLPTSHLPINHDPRNPSSNSQRSVANRVPSHSPNVSRAIPRGPPPVTIPNVIRTSEPPPPLPPPTQLPDLDEGRDIAWEWANPGRRAVLRPYTVSPGTKAWKRRESYDQLSKPSELWESRRRESSTSTETGPQSPTGFDAFPEEMNFRDEIYNSGANATISQSVSLKTLS